MNKLISAVVVATFAIGTAYAQIPAKVDVNAMANGAVDAAKTSATTTAKTAATNVASNATSAVAAQVDAKTNHVGALPVSAPSAAVKKAADNDKLVKTTAHKKHMKRHHKKSSADATKAGV
ncbi:hypothetical protein [Collimonas silvisoli]|uniref:hypothetical protein n=1 Tax=Collimonas silvisoli TaxID=2825884 RepID=UPI001B8C7139|nr:hypothetical protein [Collimonas silvisoli]